MNDLKTETVLAAIREALIYHAEMLENLAVKIDMVITQINEEKE